MLDVVHSFPVIEPTLPVVNMPLVNETTLPDIMDLPFLTVPTEPADELALQEIDNHPDEQPIIVIQVPSADEPALPEVNNTSKDEQVLSNVQNPLPTVDMPSVANSPTLPAAVIPSGSSSASSRISFSSVSLFGKGSPSPTMPMSVASAEKAVIQVASNVEDQSPKSSGIKRSGRALFFQKSQSENIAKKNRGI